MKKIFLIISFLLLSINSFAYNSICIFIPSEKPIDYYDILNLSKIIDYESKRILKPKLFYSYHDIICLTKNQTFNYDLMFLKSQFKNFDQIYSKCNYEKNYIKSKINNYNCRYGLFIDIVDIDYQKFESELNKQIDHEIGKTNKPKKRMKLNIVSLKEKTNKAKVYNLRIVLKDFKTNRNIYDQEYNLTFDQKESFYQAFDSAIKRSLYQIETFFDKNNTNKYNNLVRYKKANNFDQINQKEKVFPGFNVKHCLRPGFEVD